MASTIPIRMMSPENESTGERDTFHPETDMDYVLKVVDGQDPVALPDVLSAMYPTFATVNPGGEGERIWMHETSEVKTTLF